MKVKLLVTAAIVAATAMTSCNRNEAPANDRAAVKFSSTDMSTVQTRVNGKEWEGVEHIGIYMVEHGTTTVAESAENIDYKTLSTGENATFTPTSAAATIYYPVNTPEKVDFVAYHPYQSTLTGWVYKVNLGNQTSQTAIDLMWSGVVNNNGDGYEKAQSDVDVNLSFKHKLVKLKLSVEAGNGVENLTGLSISIKGMKSTADFDIKTGALSNEAPTATDITPKDAGSNRYEAILLPVTTLNDSHKIEFTVDGNTYTWALDADTGGIANKKLVAGSIYSYQVTLNKHDVSITGTIEDWNPGDTGTVIAD